MTAAPYDFRKPARLASELEQRMAAWLRSGCALAAGQWANHLPIRLDLSLRGLDTLRPTEGLAQFPETTIGYRVAVNAGEMHTLLVLPRPFVLALVNAALGDLSLELPADRELTAVEDAVCEFLIQRLFLALLQETWPGAESFQLSLGTREAQPRWGRLFPAAENLIGCTFVVAGPFGEQEWHWIVPQKGLLAQLNRSSPIEQPTHPGEAHGRLEALVCELPVEISVVLGVAELSLAQLARLHAGDVVLLTQRVGEPLAASVAGEPRFRVWAGRAGTRQAVRIESLTES